MILKDLAYWVLDDSGKPTVGPFCAECWEKSGSKCIMAAVLKSSCRPDFSGFARKIEQVSIKTGENIG